MTRAIFIDFDAIVDIDCKAWIVDKKNANQPIMKLSESDFFLIKSGIYKNQGNKIDFNGRIYYFPQKLWDKIKIQSKINKSDFSNLAISLQEFINSELIDAKDFEINELILEKLKNKVDDIYIISSKQTQRSFGGIFEKLRERLYESGLKIKSIYPINENFLNQSTDQIKFKKIRLFLQHLVGYKTNDKEFTDNEITRYDQIEYYERGLDGSKIIEHINNHLEFLLSKTNDGLRDVIKEDVNDFKPKFIHHRITDNLNNRISSNSVTLNISKIVKYFENFNPYS